MTRSIAPADRDRIEHRFRQSWRAEFDRRSWKSRMAMVRTDVPEMLRKEVAVHLLGYNLIRGIMAAAARVGGG